MASFQTKVALDTRRLRRALRDLPEAARHRVAPDAVDDAAATLEAAIHAETPVGKTHNLQRSIGRVTKSYASGKTVAVVGPRIDGDHDGYHGHLVHDGHVNPDGTLTPGNPWLKRVAQRLAGATLARLRRSVGRGLERSAAR